MDIMLLLQTLANMVVLGSIYSLIAIGLSLVFSIMGIINFAHGQVYMLGAYVFYFVYGQWHLTDNLGLNFLMGIIVAGLALAIVGAVLERFFFRPLRGQDLASMTVGLGLLLLLEGGALLLWGEPARYVQDVLPGTVDIYGVIIPRLRLLVMVVALLVIASIFLLLKRTNVGRAMRAVAQDPEAAALQGVDPNGMNSIGFAVGSGLAAVAAALLLPIGYVNPFVGGPIVMKAFTMVILGGLGSLPGAVAGAFLVGISESFGYTFLGQFAALASFALILLVLIIKPKGLMGRG